MAQMLFKKTCLNCQLANLVKEHQGELVRLNDAKITINYHYIKSLSVADFGKSDFMEDKRCTFEIYGIYAL